jgi:type II secretory pathway pseudopilin PulG
MKPKTNNRRVDGFATVDFLIVAVIILIIVTYAWTAVMQAQRWQAREGAARQFASFIERARSDSTRRRATDAKQMAQVTILNNSFYSVTVDENGDGALDAPRVVSLHEQQLTIDGPYPRTYMFDRTGKAVDSSGNAIQQTVVTFANRSGKSVVKVSDDGQAAPSPSQGDNSKK